MNVITGDEISIFPDQTKFLERLGDIKRENDILAIPGTVIEISPETISVTHPENIDVEKIFAKKNSTCANIKQTGQIG